MLEGNETAAEAAAKAQTTVGSRVLVLPAFHQSDARARASLLLLCKELRGASHRVAVTC